MCRIYHGEEKMKHLIFPVLLLLALFTCVAPVSAYPFAPSDSCLENALGYLHTCQKPDGGFGEASRDSNPGTSTWAILALVAADEDPHAWVVGENSPIDYLKTIAPETAELQGTSETAKMILTLVATGYDPSSFEGYDFVAMLRDKQKASGQYGDHIYTTAWSVLAMAAAGEDTRTGSAWLESQQNDDGGFGWTLGSESDNDDTAATLMALIAAGRTSSSPSVQKTVSFLKAHQESDGGFNYGGSSSSNAASDSWVIQALVAAGEDPSVIRQNGLSPVDNLCSYQSSDGSFMWTTLLTDNPCRMTASAIPALLGRPYPMLPEDNSPVIVSSAQTSELKTSGTPKSTPVVRSAEQPGEAITVIDDFGTEITIPSTPQRIISLAPANTEILYALGLGSRIVGVTDYCNYPAETASVEKVGGYSTPNIEKILAANPDLIVASFGNTEEVADRLRDFGLTVISTNPLSIEDVLNDIRLIGKATGTEQKADELAANLQSRIDTISRTANSAETQPGVTHMIWYDPLWVSGNATFQDEMFDFVNAENAFPDVEGWDVVSLETFIATNPEVIIVSSGAGMGEEGRDIIYNYVYDEPRFSEMDAVKNKRVYVIDADVIDRGGPRIVDALEEVATFIHPDLFEVSESVATPDSAQTPLSAPVLIMTCLGFLLLAGRRNKP